MSDRRRTRFAPGDPGAPAQQYQEEMSRRRQERSVSIRKQKREERLWRRRQPAAVTKDTTISVQTLMDALDVFLGNSPGGLKELQETLAGSPSSATNFLKDLIENCDNETKCRALVSSLSEVLKQSILGHESTAVLMSSLAILLDLSSSTASPTILSDNYYGMAPLRWSDLISEDSSLLENLLGLLRSPSIPVETLGRVCNVLGNLLQDTPRLVPFILPVWTDIVDRLPDSAYLCATLVRQDRTHIGTSFLSVLTPEQIAALLGSEATAAEAAWMIEGLSRREDDAIHILCSSPTMVEIFVQSLSIYSNCQNQAVQVPLLQSTFNLTMALHGKYAPLFLQQHSFLPSLTRLLENRTTLDVLAPVGSLLSWNLCHAENQFPIISSLVPPLLQIIVKDEAGFGWKSEAMWALRSAIRPVDSTGRRMSRHEENTVNWIWENLTLNQHYFLLELIKNFDNPDAELVLSSVEIVDSFVRCTDTFQEAFDGLDGVSKLETICERGEQGGLLEKAAELAADLLDEFFEEDETLHEVSNVAPPETGSNSFSFDFNQVPNAFTFGDANGAGRGRGRGLTAPAWMQQIEK